MYFCRLVSSCVVWGRFDSLVPPALWQISFRNGPPVHVQSWKSHRSSRLTTRLCLEWMRGPTWCFFNFLLIFSDYSFWPSTTLGAFIILHDIYIYCKAEDFCVIVLWFSGCLSFKCLAKIVGFFCNSRTRFFSVFIPRSVSTLVASSQVLITLESLRPHLDLYKYI
jgi:hypothetical protein